MGFPVLIGNLYIESGPDVRARYGMLQGEQLPVLLHIMIAFNEYVCILEFALDY